jgi:hypothetical protein
MNREEMIKTIRDLAGGKMIFDENWNVRVSVGDDRPVCAVTKKYIYLGCKCYVKTVWENDDILVSAIRRVPVCGSLYGDITSKVELDSLCTRDLEAVYAAVLEYFEWQINRIVGLQQQLDECLKFRMKYNKVMKK